MRTDCVYGSVRCVRGTVDSGKRTISSIYAGTTCERRMEAGIGSSAWSLKAGRCRLRGNPKEIVRWRTIQMLGSPSHTGVLNLEKVIAEKALFIKLGEGGEWESECIAHGALRLGYRSLPHESCLSSSWDEVRKSFPTTSDQGSLTRHINQVQQFYEEPASTLWITFHSDRLWWCFANTKVEQLEDRSRIRDVIGQWSDSDIHGVPLIKGRLSGKLLATQGFQGTICTVKEFGYLLHKINGTTEPHVAEAQAAFEQLALSLIPIIRNLHPKDLETLTDLIFRQAGWQRTGVAGEVEKDIDLDLISPITQERIAIQVKSKASFATFESYQAKFADMRGFKRFYFVTHSPDPKLQSAMPSSNDGAFALWGADQLAQQAVRNGLVGWLLDKAS